jgi:hypothetical protein
MEILELLEVEVPTDLLDLIEMTITLTKRKTRKNQMKRKKKRKLKMRKWQLKK